MADLDSSIIALRIRLDAVLAANVGIKHTLNTYEAGVLERTAAIQGQMSDLSAAQREYDEAQTMAARQPTQVDVRARIEGRKVQTKVLEKENAELEKEIARIRADLKAAASKTSGPRASASVSSRTRPSKPLRVPSPPSSSSSSPSPSPSRPKVSRPKSPTKLKVTKVASGASAALPNPPDGSADWTTFYTQKHNLRLAKAQARWGHPDPRKIVSKNIAYGRILASPKPCTECVRKCIPCLRVDVSERGNLSHAPSRCLICHYTRRNKPCEDDRKAKQHAHAERIVEYHNVAIELGQRPGIWMGVGIPDLDIDAVQNAIEEAALKRKHDELVEYEDSRNAAAVKKLRSHK
ncbi:hypothetical protein MKEN_01002000 [Mycena kentingensis (nom. inval.)]|nr:hypothetical protein MKEN_01002000 [Mycena kentingensis (nom. inval.)]